jgi:hypothetical protein
MKVAMGIGIVELGSGHGVNLPRRMDSTIVPAVQGVDKAGMGALTEWGVN